ncbi:MAG: hypothetical protein IJE08_00680 [Clostridia bacterium]|nr:hypothetical protein [Clostridia bacterium]
MTSRKWIALLLTLICFLTGLFLPALTVRLQDIHLSGSHWPLNHANGHYAYQGTLLNRVLALNAHLNSSPALFLTNREPADIPSGIIETLNAFLPVSVDHYEAAETFTLVPRQYAAEYRYAEAIFTGENYSLTVIIDEETGLPLRIELTAEPDIISLYLNENGLWGSLTKYANTLSLGELADGPTGISTLIQSQSAQIRGTQLGVTVTAMPSAGTLLFKLTGSVSP